MKFSGGGWEIFGGGVGKFSGGGDGVEIFSGGDKIFLEGLEIF